MKIYKTFFFYIIKEFAISFLITYLLIFSLFFVNQIIVIIQDLLEKKVNLWDTLKISGAASPIFISMSLPFGVLLGTLLTVGRFSTDNEMVAFQTLGLKLHDVFAPILILSFFVMIFAFWCYDYFVPLGNLKYRKMYSEIVYSNPNIVFEPNSIQNFSSRNIITGKIENGNIKDMLIFDKDSKGNRRIINGHQIKLLSNSDSGAVSMQMNDVFSLSAKDIKEYNYFNAKKMIYSILLDDIDNSLDGITTGEKGIFKTIADTKILKEEKKQDNQSYFKQALVTYYKSKNIINESITNREKENYIEVNQEDIDYLSDFFKTNLKNYSIQKSNIELMQKLMWPTMCMIFAIIGFGTGIFSKRSGKSVGLGIGGVLSIVYYFAFFGAKGFSSSSQNINEFLVMSLPNLAFLLIGLIVFFKKTKV